MDAEFPLAVFVTFQLGCEVFVNFLERVLADVILVPVATKFKQIIILFQKSYAK